MQYNKTKTPPIEFSFILPDEYDTKTLFNTEQVVQLLGGKSRFNRCLKNGLKPTIKEGSNETYYAYHDVVLNSSEYLWSMEALPDSIIELLWKKHNIYYDWKKFPIDKNLKCCHCGGVFPIRAVKFHREYDFFERKVVDLVVCPNTPICNGNLIDFEVATKKDISNLSKIKIRKDVEGMVTKNPKTLYWVWDNHG